MPLNIFVLQLLQLQHILNPKRNDIEFKIVHTEPNSMHVEILESEIISGCKRFVPTRYGIIDTLRTLNDGIQKKTDYLIYLYDYTLQTRTIEHVIIEDDISDQNLFIARRRDPSIDNLPFHRIGDHPLFDELKQQDGNKQDEYGIDANQQNEYQINGNQEEEFAYDNIKTEEEPYQRIEQININSKDFVDQQFNVHDNLQRLEQIK